MSSNMEDYILYHLTSLHDEEVEFISGHSETQSHFLDQSIEEETREIGEALRILAQEVAKMQKRKRNPHKWYHKM